MTGDDDGARNAERAAGTSRKSGSVALPGQRLIALALRSEHGLRARPGDADAHDLTVGHVGRVLEGVVEDELALRDAELMRDLRDGVAGAGEVHGDGRLG